MVVSGFLSTSISQPLQETWDRKAALPQASKLKQKNKYRKRPAQPQILKLKPSTVQGIAVIHVKETGN
jgi:hypothetical protein